MKRGKKRTLFLIPYLYPCVSVFIRGFLNRRIAMNWLLEDPTPIYWMLGVLALALVFALFITKRLLYAGLAGGLVLLAGGAWLLDYLVQTDREEVTEKCFQLGAAAEQADFDRLAELLTRDCSVTSSIPGAQVSARSREEILGHARAYLPARGSREITVWVVEITSSRDGRAHTCHCDIRARGDFGLWQINMAFVKADFTFAKEPDGQWRVRQMQLRYYEPQ